MAVKKIEYDGHVLIDLTTDTVTSANDIAIGKIGHLNDGTVVTGTHSGGSGGTDVYAAINRNTNVNVSDTNLSTVMARGIYAGTEPMSSGDELTAGIIYIQYE